MLQADKIGKCCQISPLRTRFEEHGRMVHSNAMSVKSGSRCETKTAKASKVDEERMMYARVSYEIFNRHMNC